MAMTIEQLQAQLAALQSENEILKAKKAAGGKLAFKVSEKGAVSVYGLGRFPVTLYANQMERLLSHADEIRKFMKDNVALLKNKGDGDETVATTPAAPAGAMVVATPTTLSRK